MRLPLSYSCLRLFHADSSPFIKCFFQVKLCSLTHIPKSSLNFNINQLYATHVQNTRTSGIIKKLSGLQIVNPPFNTVIRNLTHHHIDKPSPETTHKNLRYKVHYPEDGKYTIKKLDMTKLGGRDPDTGRIIFGKIGGGHKRKYRWVIYNRLPENSPDPLIERVIHIQYDPNRTARIALVGHGDQLRFIIATTSMKRGDLITSTRELPQMPIRPKEGDAHPIGALPFGTQICCIEKMPGGERGWFKVNAGSSTTVSRKLGDKYVVQADKRKEFALDKNCLVVVGQVSNPDQNKIPIGSAQRSRWLGIRPSSGLWQRKGGRQGRKVKRAPPIAHFESVKPPLPILRLTLTSEEPSKPIVPATNRVS